MNKVFEPINIAQESMPTDMTPLILASLDRQRESDLRVAKWSHELWKQQHDEKMARLKEEENEDREWRRQQHAREMARIEASVSTPRDYYRGPDPLVIGIVVVILLLLNGGT